ncbi:DUF1450 domain-containing protein [Alicyclobacillus shizuokensis]|uniref:DUF1450 domain-containing protein n=1 Tax=Alicyclobacillus shizuokensis TaxID=392014 RepID=UPI00082F6C4B|nr:DUF1450 domain-containing protein [Alicyclobacillus shizuokensis]MCL6626353.1 YuzB family protein [Alicyclobacillus shizuokensis]
MIGLESGIVSVESRLNSQPVIEVCRENLELGSGAVLKRLEAAGPDLQVHCLACTEQCELCTRRPFLWLDDELVEARDAADLWSQLTLRLPSLHR